MSEIPQEIWKKRVHLRLPLGAESDVGCLGVMRVTLSISTSLYGTNADLLQAISRAILAAIWYYWSGVAHALHGFNVVVITANQSTARKRCSATMGGDITDGDFVGAGGRRLLKKTEALHNFH